MVYIGSMNTTSRYLLTQVTDAELLAGLARLVARQNQVTAELLAHLAEVDARRLYLPAGCSSMFAYGVRVLGLSEDATYKRIQAARAARQYPLIFDLIAAGKLHLAAVTLLAPHLSRDNHRGLLTAALGRSKRDVERLVAERFPSPDVPAMVRKLPGPAPASVPPPAGTLSLPLPAARPDALAPTPQTAMAIAPPPTAAAPELAPGQVGADEVGSVGTVASLPPPRPAVIAPLCAARFKVQFTASQELHDKLRAAQNLLGHAVPSGDLAQVFEQRFDGQPAVRGRGGLQDRNGARRALAVPDRRSNPDMRPRPHPIELLAVLLRFQHELAKPYHALREEQI